MIENKIVPDSGLKVRTGTRLRSIGVLILLVGLVGAGLDYWLVAPPEKLPVEMTADYKRAARGMESNFGKMGAFSDALAEDLKDPATQAAIIAITSVIAAAGCFVVAELKNHSKRP